MKTFDDGSYQVIYTPPHLLINSNAQTILAAPFAHKGFDTVHDKTHDCEQGDNPDCETYERAHNPTHSRNVTEYRRKGSHEVQANEDED